MPVGRIYSLPVEDWTYLDVSDWVKSLAPPPTSTARPHRRWKCGVKHSNDTRNCWKREYWMWNKLYTTSDFFVVCDVFVQSILLPSFATLHRLYPTPAQ